MNRPLGRILIDGSRWLAVALGLMYLVLLAGQFGAVLRASNLDADAVSAQVIGELFGHAGAHASTVLGTFGWYATLMFELATKWLPSHHYVWEVMPYTLALGSVVLVAWSVWRLAGRWAAATAAVLLVCTSPITLHLLLSMTQHGPDWFCCSLLGAFIVAIEQRERRLRLLPMSVLAVLVGLIVGVNAASDALLLVAGVLPFALALLASHALAWRDDSPRCIGLAAVMFAAMLVMWVLTHVLMSAWRVAPEAGLQLFTLADASQISKNVGLWLQSVTRLANGNFYGRDPSASSLAALICAVLSLAAVAWLPRLGWLELRRAGESWQRQRAERQLDTAASTQIQPQAAVAPERLAFVVFWCSSAIALSGVFLLSGYLVDVGSDRYLVGLVYAAAALIPMYAAGRFRLEAVVVVGTCLFALSGISSLLQRVATEQGSPSTRAADAIATLAAEHNLKYGYAGYWDASPITWATNLRVHVYPVSTCDENHHLCPFDLHVISSWYTPRPGIQSFLLVDPAQPLIPGPTPYLGPPSAVYHIGRISMYVYPYDIARRFDTRYEQWRTRSS